MQWFRNRLSSLKWLIFRSGSWRPCGCLVITVFKAVRTGKALHAVGKWVSARSIGSNSSVDADPVQLNFTGLSHWVRSGQRSDRLHWSWQLGLIEAPAAVVQAPKWGGNPVISLPQMSGGSYSWLRVCRPAIWRGTPEFCIPLAFIHEVRVNRGNRCRWNCWSRSNWKYGTRGWQSGGRTSDMKDIKHWWVSLLRTKTCPNHKS